MVNEGVAAFLEYDCVAAATAAISPGLSPGAAGPVPGAILRHTASSPLNTPLGSHEGPQAISDGLNADPQVSWYFDVFSLHGLGLNLWLLQLEGR